MILLMFTFAVLQWKYLWKWFRWFYYDFIHFKHCKQIRWLCDKLEYMYISCWHSQRNANSMFRVTMWTTSNCLYASNQTQCSWYWCYRSPISGKLVLTMPVHQIHCARHSSLLPLFRECSPSSPINVKSAHEYVADILMLVCLPMDEGQRIGMVQHDV